MASFPFSQFYYHLFYHCLDFGHDLSWNELYSIERYVRYHSIMSLSLYSAYAIIAVIIL
jgi:hypothetical protein